MASIADYLTELGITLRAKLDAINVKLKVKGQSEAADLNSVPDLIEAISTGIDTTISSNAASASDIRIGKKAYVNGSLVTGNMDSVSVPKPTINVSSKGTVTADVSQSAGYTPGGSISSDSVRLSETHCETFLEENIAENVTIFGKTGSFSGKKTICNAEISADDLYSPVRTITFDCKFEPKYVHIFTDVIISAIEDDDLLIQSVFIEQAPFNFNTSGTSSDAIRGKVMRRGSTSPYSIEKISVSHSVDKVTITLDASVNCGFAPGGTYTVIALC